MNGLDVDKLDWRSNRYRRRVILGAGEKGVTELLMKKLAVRVVQYYALIIASVIITVTVIGQPRY